MKKYEAVDVGDMVLARMRLLNKHPWFGVLVQRLKVVEQTKEFFEKQGFLSALIGTDGQHIFYNKDEFSKLPVNEKLFMVAQQVLRCALFHFSRRGSRDQKRWNLAGVIVANGMLVADKVGVMPSGEPHVPEYNGLSTEQVYEKLLEQKPQGEDKQPPQGKGCVVDGGQQPQDEKGEDEGGQPVQQDQSAVETQWKIAMEQAQMELQKRGLKSSSAERAVNLSHESKVNWRDVVRQWVQVKGDVTWSKPNRRFIGRGLYLPSIKKSKMGHIVFGIDTSGSTLGPMQDLFASELNELLGAMEEWPERVTVIGIDSEVKSVEDQEGSLNLNVLKGGGGTAFQPLFDYIKDEGWEPQVVFYLTDLMGDECVKPEGYPVVWVTPKGYEQYHQQRIGWGDLIVVED